MSGIKVLLGTERDRRGGTLREAPRRAGQARSGGPREHEGAASPEARCRRGRAHEAERRQHELDESLKEQHRIESEAQALARKIWREQAVQQRAEQIIAEETGTAASSGPSKSSVTNARGEAAKAAWTPERRERQREIANRLSLKESSAEHRARRVAAVVRGSARPLARRCSGSSRYTCRALAARHRLPRTS